MINLQNLSWRPSICSGLQQIDRAEFEHLVKFEVASTKLRSTYLPHLVFHRGGNGLRRNKRKDGDINERSFYISISF
jgi:hypothetical protein